MSRLLQIIVRKYINESQHQIKLSKIINSTKSHRCIIIPDQNGKYHKDVPRRIDVDTFISFL
jgi:hypothetical protein